MELYRNGIMIKFVIYVNNFLFWDLVNFLYFLDFFILEVMKVKLSGDVKRGVIVVYV